MFGNNCSQSYKTKKKLMLTICRKQETNCSLILCWPIQPNFPPRLQTLSLYNVNLLPLCSGPVQVFTRKTNICVTHPSADRTTAEELATWSGLSNPSRTCLSLSFAFPLPDTRDEVTSRGMTEIWCSGMFIPAEPTGGRSHTHFLSHSRSQEHDGLNYDALPAMPCRGHTEDSKRVSDETTNSNTVWKQAAYRCTWRRLKHNESVQRKLKKKRNESAEVTQLHFGLSSHQLITWPTSSAARLLQMFLVRNPINDSIQILMRTLRNSTSRSVFIHRWKPWACFIYSCATVFIYQVEETIWVLLLLGFLTASPFDHANCFWNTILELSWGLIHFTCKETALQF